MKYMLFGLSLLIAQQLNCYSPTRAIKVTQRKVPFFKILVYEVLPTAGGGAVSIMLFEDESGTCYITSGTDGGVVVIPKTSCDAAKKPALEPTK